MADVICSSLCKQRRHLLEYKYLQKNVALQIAFRGTSVRKYRLMSLARIIACIIFRMYAPSVLLELFS